MSFLQRGVELISAIESGLAIYLSPNLIRIFFHKFQDFHTSLSQAFS